MIQLAMPLLISLVDVFMDRKKIIAQKTGVSESVISSVTDVFADFLVKDKDVLDLTASHMQNARSHDIETFDKADLFSNRFRSIVRPICTFIAISWYVFARVNEIPLQQEDYAIIGGILAFWFGFRPFEKRN